jgi:simple sugar transport system ATP-binding protein
MAPVLRIAGITKRFADVVANDGIDLEASAGEIHAILGENGSGKTTLMNVLFGLYAPDAGSVEIRGERVAFASPRDAIARGVGMVHQHFMLVPTLTVAQNVVLGLPGPRGPWDPRLDLAGVEARLRELADTYRFQLDPGAPVWALPVGAQQRVEILKALYRGAHILILDEPTAVLTPQEAHELFDILRALAAQGRVILFITHKLDEVMAVSHRVTVLRAGRVVGVMATDAVDPPTLARMMVGRDVAATRPARTAPSGEPLLTVEALEAHDDREAPALRGVSFAVHGGEIFGLAGVDGNGQRELAEVVMGLRPARAGTVRVAGETSPRGRVRRVGHIPEDRLRTGLVGPFSVAENLMLKAYHRPPFTRLGLLDDGAARAHAEAAMRDFDIRAPGPRAPVRTLSGGNQQKVVLARELVARPRVLVATQPTRGLDVGATEYVHRRLLAARDAGCAVLLISTDLDEVLALGDRVGVLSAGRLVAVLPAAEASRDRLAPLMAGLAAGTPAA